MRSSKDGKLLMRVMGLTVSPHISQNRCIRKSLGGSSEVVPPVPIPNTEVKHLSADDTALVTVWENRSLPGGFLFGQSPVRSFVSNSRVKCF